MATSRRTALLGAVSIGAAACLSACAPGTTGGGPPPSGQGAGTCPQVPADPVPASPSAAPSPNPADVEEQARAWRAGGSCAWRTVTTLGTGQTVFEEEYLAHGPATSSFTDFPGSPTVAHEDDERLVVVYGYRVAALSVVDGTELWSADLEAGTGAGADIGGVGNGLLWTSGGAVDLRSGQVHPLPEVLRGADSLAAEDGMVVGLAGELVALRVPGCEELWRVTPPDGGTVWITSDSVEVGHHRFDKSSGEYQGSVDYDVVRFPDNDGLFVAVEITAPEGVDALVVVDDDGSEVRVRHLEPAENRSSVSRDELRAAPTTWSVPLEARPGAVMALAAERRRAYKDVARSFWVLDLGQDGALAVSRWVPAQV